MSAELVPRRILPAIVLSQLAGATLWFAINAVMPELSRETGLAPSAIGVLTSSVNAGFIAGTLVFALLTVADRFSPRRVFLLCAFAGAGCNAAAVLAASSFELLLALRFATGFFLAGIYPVGMKIASGWYTRGLGAALGFLVGALVLGTAAPHGLHALLDESLPWQGVMVSTSVIAAAGGLLMFVLVPDGPYLARTDRIDPAALRVIWTDRKVRASAFGYFGHMWELYAVWVLAPMIVARRFDAADVPAAAFAMIGLGCIGCAAGGVIAQRIGSARVAAIQLAASGVCCLLAPLMFDAPLALFAVWLAVWGTTVVGDSPQFSALSANNSPREFVGSVLTFVNCIGFAISIVSIQFLVWLLERLPLEIALPWLAIGPAVGLRMLRPLLRSG